MAYLESPPPRALRGRARSSVLRAPSEHIGVRPGMRYTCARVCNLLREEEPEHTTSSPKQLHQALGNKVPIVWFRNKMFRSHPNLKARVGHKYH